MFITRKKINKSPIVYGFEMQYVIILIITFFIGYILYTALSSIVSIYISLLIPIVLFLMVYFFIAYLSSRFKENSFIKYLGSFGKIKKVTNKQIEIFKNL